MPSWSRCRNRSRPWVRQLRAEHRTSFADLRLCCHRPGILLQSGSSFFIACVAVAEANAPGSKLPPTHSSSPTPRITGLRSPILQTIRLASTGVFGSSSAKTSSPQASAPLTQPYPFRSLISMGRSPAPLPFIGRGQLQRGEQPGAAVRGRHTPSAPRLRAESALRLPMPAGRTPAC
jgi:hypothetical protein